MRALAALIAVALLATGFAACGESKDTSTRAGAPHKDRDNDHDNNDDDQGTLGYGHVPGAPESQAIAALVKSYFADAAAESGAKACALLTPFLAESVVEVDGHSPGLRGSTCAAVMTKLFARHHRDLQAKQAALKVMRIGVQGSKSLVALDFPEIPEVREMVLRRYNGSWTVLQLLDGIIE